MRIAYGFNRPEKALRRLNADRFYLDGPGTDRIERRYLLRDLRAGDTLVVLAISDLGAGKGLRNMRAELDARDIAVEVVEPEKEQPKRPPGRPSAWNPSPADDDRIRALYDDWTIDGGYVIDQACEAMGEDKSQRLARERVRGRLLRRYGPRPGA
ncbi:MAG: hypothetical protein AAFM92_03330 [Pseudomonadota bacterium]